MKKLFKLLLKGWIILIQYFKLLECIILMKIFKKHRWYGWLKMEKLYTRYRIKHVDLIVECLIDIFKFYVFKKMDCDVFDNLMNTKYRSIYILEGFEHEIMLFGEIVSLDCWDC